MCLGGDAWSRLPVLTPWSAMFIGERAENYALLLECDVLFVLIRVISWIGFFRRDTRSTKSQERSLSSRLSPACVCNLNFHPYPVLQIT